MSERERDVFELYAENPIKADEVLFGRTPHADRRGFLKGAGLATMAALLGGYIPFHRQMPAGLIPVAMATEPFRIEGKDGLVVINDRPLNAETPAHLLDDAVTPTARHFIRNNGTPPEAVDAASWTLRIDGEVDQPLEMTIAELQDRFEVVTLQLQLECAGNGRAFFAPKASGNQWTYGAIGCSEWTGVRLADILEAAGVKDTAVYTGHYGADEHLSGNPDKRAISRGVPIGKALDPHNLIAFAQNGGPLHPMNGYPLRLLIPGWPGSCSQKWLQRIWVRDRVHDGEKMTGASYRLPRHPVAPGAEVPDEDFVIIESMPVKSLITFPQTGAEIAAASPVTQVRGHAWAGDDRVAAVDVSIDFGATWQRTSLTEPVNRYAWQHFQAEVRFPIPGYYELWARATDDQGRAQPFVAAWNPEGYNNNAMHRVALRVA